MEYFNVYPSKNDIQLPEKISVMEEFRKNKALKNENVKPGCLYSYQKLFGSLSNVYNRLFLINDPGTGKTISFIQACEQAKETGIYKRAVILEKGTSIIPGIVDDIFKVSAVYETTIKKNRTKRTIKDFYEITTYTKFIKSIYDMKNDEEIIDNYSNTVFVFDEVHNLIGDAIISSKMEVIYKMLEICKNIKVILVSATPVVSEIEQIMPYIRLLGINNDKKLNLEDMKTKDLTLTIKNIFQNTVSYISSEKSKALPVYISRDVNGVIKRNKENNFSLYYSELKGLQKEKYIHYFNEEKGEFNRNAIQAAAFVFPDGSISGSVKDKNPKGLSKYVKTTKTNGIFDYTKLGYNDFLDNDLSEYSAKMKSIIEIESKPINGTTFIYTGDMKNGGGAIILSMILEKQARFNNYLKNKNHKGINFVLITPSLEQNQIDNIKEVFNSAENYNGNLIKILIGTVKLKEGISFNHVTRVHLLNRAWVYSNDIQSISRALRVKSHDILIEKIGLKKQLEVEIYKHAIFTLPLPTLAKGNVKMTDNSIDYYIENTMANRQEKIDAIMEGLKEAAIDLYLTYERNERVVKKHSLFSFSSSFVITNEDEKEKRTFENRAILIVIDLVLQTTKNVSTWKI